MKQQQKNMKKQLNMLLIKQLSMLMLKQHQSMLMKKLLIIKQNKEKSIMPQGSKVNMLLLLRR